MLRLSTGVQLGPVTDIGGQLRRPQVGEEAQRLCVLQGGLACSHGASPRLPDSQSL